MGCECTKPEQCQERSREQCSLEQITKLNTIINKGNCSESLNLTLEKIQGTGQNNSLVDVSNWKQLSLLVCKKKVSIDIEIKSYWKRYKDIRFDFVMYKDKIIFCALCNSVKAGKSYFLPLEWTVFKELNTNLNNTPIFYNNELLQSYNLQLINLLVGLQVKNVQSFAVEVIYGIKDIYKNICDLVYYVSYVVSTSTHCFSSILTASAKRNDFIEYLIEYIINSLK
jgi:hypothetical protein